MKNLIHSVPLLIIVVFSATGADEVVYAQVGQTVTLTPLEVNGASERYLYWYSSNKNEAIANHNPLSGWKFTSEEKWRNRLSVSKSALTITSLQEDDFGTFTFSKFNEQSRVSDAVYKVQLSIITVNMTPSSPLLAGESLSLDCNVETPKDREKPGIYWLSPQNKKMNSNKHISKVKATVQHNGQWTCVVKNGQKENKAIISVTVVDLSPPSSLPQYTSKSSPLTIPCSILPQITWDQIKTKGIQEVEWQFFPKLSSGVVSGDPQKLFSLSLDTLQWKADHLTELNPVPTVNNGNLSLTKRQGRENDRGDYVCIMKFNNGVTLNRTVHVELLQIIASPGTNLTSGQQLNLTCGIGRGLSSDLQLKWIPPQKSFHPSLKSDPHPANFIIPEVTTGDNGKWRCELWQGSTRVTSEMITLKIEYKLSVWMQVIICSAAVIVILLLILVFILYRRRQRKMRHPRHRLCQCKHPKPKGFYKT